MSTRRRRRRCGWLIVGHYGGHNLGDEAMLLGLMQGYRPQALLGAGRRTTDEVEPRLGVVVLGGKLPGFLAAGWVDAVAPRLGSVLGRLVRSRGVVLGGGTHFHDDYRPARLLRHCRHLIRIAALGWTARLLGRKVVWLSVGLGPLDLAPTRWLTRAAAAGCHAITVRDRASLGEIGRWPAARRTSRAIDVAALMPRVRSSRPASRAPGPTVVGVSATSSATSRTLGPSIDARLREGVRRGLAAALEAHADCEVRIFVARGGPREDDGEISAELADGLRSTAPDRVSVIGHHDDPRQTLREIGECTLFVAMRYHALLLAYLAGLPTLAVAYHRKVADLAAEIGLAAEAVYLPGPGRSAAQLEARIAALLADPARFRATLPVEEAIASARTHIHVLERLDSSWR